MKGLPSILEKGEKQTVIHGLPKDLYPRSGKGLASKLKDKKTMPAIIISGRILFLSADYHGITQSHVCKYNPKVNRKATKAFSCPVNS